MKVVKPLLEMLEGGGVKTKAEIQPHTKGFKLLKKNNMPVGLNNAPRCGARTRKGTLCKGPAMVNGRCRMHGGKSTGPPKGNTNALKHGHYTKIVIEQRKMLRKLLSETEEYLNRINLDV